MKLLAIAFFSARNLLGGGRTDERGGKQEPANKGRRPTGRGGQPNDRSTLSASRTPSRNSPS